VAVTDRGFIGVDGQMRTNVPHIFAIGDLVGQPMLAHKAVHEAHVAAEAAHGEKAYFDAKVIPSVAYTDPEVAWAGLTEDEAKQKGIKVEKGHFPWAASGRAVANGRDEGFTKLLFDAETHRIIGGTIVGTNAGDMIGEVALAIEMGADGVDIGKTIHPHPTLGESIGMAAEVYKGVILHRLAAAGASAEIAQERYSPAGFKLSLGLKDVGLANDAAAEQGLRLRFGAVLRETLQQAVARGDGELDLAALARMSAPGSA
jgi:pyruvate/2-oxoglutarate dehydrogenase complex dihydrolipoamide acyltransferase (E2) component